MKNTDWLWLILLSIIWGSAFMFIKMALKDLTPFLLVFGRLCLGAVFMLITCRLLGVKFPTDKRVWFSLGFLGIVNSALPFLLVAWAQQHVDSGTASILNATSPVFVMILAHFFTDDEKLTLRKAAGVISGFCGIIVMVIPALKHGIILAGMAQLAILGATFNYSIGGIYARRFRGIHPMIVSALSLLGASVAISPMLLFAEIPALASLQTQTIFSVVMLGFLCTGVAFIIYFKVLASAGATNVLLVTLMIPVSALILSTTVLGEQIKPTDIGGMALIFSGLLIIDGRILAYARRRKATLQSNGASR